MSCMTAGTDPNGDRPVHPRCGEPYDTGNLLGHLQTACPSPPTEADLCAFIDRILDRSPRD